MKMKEKLNYAEQVLVMQKELKELQAIKNKSYEDCKRIYNLQYTIEYILVNFL